MIDPLPPYEQYEDHAQRLYDAGDYDAALQVLRDGLGSHPRSAPLQTALGYVRVAREEWAWARGAFAAALELEPDNEDALVGLGETLLKLGDAAGAQRCFSRLAELGVQDDLEIGLAVGRVFYREEMYEQAEERFSELALVHPASAEILTARAYSRHALGDVGAARADLRRALRLDALLHEARLYLGHLLYDGGMMGEALREFERVPPAEHWDPLALWRLLELRAVLLGTAADDPRNAAWSERLADLEDEPDAIDHLLAEVEAGWSGDIPEGAAAVHRIRTLDGTLFEGSWEEIVAALRDAFCEGDETIETFMSRTARQVLERTGRELPSASAEEFVRGSAEAGLLRIEE